MLVVHDLHKDLGTVVAGSAGLRTVENELDIGRHRRQPEYRPCLGNGGRIRILTFYPEIELLELQQGQKRHYAGIMTESQVRGHSPSGDSLIGTHYNIFKKYSGIVF